MSKIRGKSKEIVVMDMEDLRKEYHSPILERKMLKESPFDQFHKWFDEAVQAGVVEPNAMTLSTATKEGKPSSRTVLLKGFSSAGLLYFTNYESRKARETAENPHAVALFLWKEMERQVSIEGTVEKASRGDSEKYFARRPRENQLSAWTSHQDRVIENREVLEREYKELEKEYEGQPIPCPPFWGGFLLKPTHFDFWQGGERRLHDRFQYTPEGENWKIERLSP